MTTQPICAQTPELVDAARGCAVYDSQWRPDHTPDKLNVQVSGQVLQAEMEQWQAGQQQAYPANAGEEMGAVLEGCFELRCDTEVHILTAGQGILIPAGYARTWTAQEAGVLYRVTCPAQTAAAQAES